MEKDQMYTEKVKAAKTEKQLLDRCKNEVNN